MKARGYSEFNEIEIRRLEGFFVINLSKFTRKTFLMDLKIVESLKIVDKDPLKDFLKYYQ